MTLKQQIEKLHEAGHALGDIAAQLALDYDASEGLLYLGGWIADGGNCEVEYPDAESGSEAANEYVSDGDWGSGDETIAVEVMAWRPALRVDSDGDLVDEHADHNGHLITIEPDEPDCKAADDGAHRWDNPYMLVGGCDSNPGVWGGQGCSIASVDVCVLCGLSRTSRTASQGYETAHDHDCTRYGGDSDIAVDDLLQYHDGCMPAGLSSDSELAEALRDTVDDMLSELGHDDDNIERDSGLNEWTVAVPTDEAEAAMGEIRKHLGHCNAAFRAGSNSDDWQEIAIVLKHKE